MKSYLVKNTQKKLTVDSGEEKQFVVFLDKTSDYNFSVDLKGDNCYAEILGLVIADGNEKINLQTTQHHVKKHTTSNLLVRSLLLDQAIFSFSGLIRIEKEGNLSDAYQKNESLLLSPKAKSEAKPYLEILARDVRCTHGATLGTINEEEIFYLSTRGISEKQAKQLIIEGFFQEVLDKIQDQQIKNLLIKKIEQKLS